jgi:hypothetical protein
MAEAIGLLIVGRRVVTVVEKVRFEAVVRQDCRSMVGRIIEAMVDSYNRASPSSIDVLKLQDVVGDNIRIPAYPRQYR